MIDRTHWANCWRSRSHWRCAVARVEALEKAINECQQRLEEQSGKEYLRLRRQIEGLTGAINSSEAGLADALENIEVLNEALDAACEDRDWHSDRLDKYLARARRAESKLAECRAALAITNEQLTALEAADRQWDKTSLCEIVEERNELRKELESYKEIAAGNMQEWNRCEEELAEAHEEIQALRREHPKDQGSYLTDELLQKFDQFDRHNEAAEFVAQSLPKVEDDLHQSQAEADSKTPLTVDGLPVNEPNIWYGPRPGGEAGRLARPGCDPEAEASCHTHEFLPARGGRRACADADCDFLLDENETADG